MEYIKISVQIFLGLIGLYFAVRFQIAQKNKLLHDIFIHYNSKYAEINEKIKRVIESESPLTAEDKDVIYDYLNLCAEEYVWYKRRLICKKIWSNWFVGMMDYLNTPKFMKIIKEEEDKKLDYSYYGFLTYIKSMKNKHNKIINSI